MRTPGIIRRQVKQRKPLRQIQQKMNELDVHNEGLHQKTSDNGHLDYSNMNIGSVPLEIFDKKVLLSLNLSQNCIQQLPKKLNLSKFTLLESLNLSRNNFSKFTIPKMQSLRTLLIDQNHLSALSLENQPFLKVLSCRRNEIDSLSIPYCLETLHADGNRFQNLYFLGSIGIGCNYLTELSLADNILYDVKLIPEQYRLSKIKISYPNLKTFILSGNKIIHLDGLQTVKNLKKLDLNNNQISFSRSILNQLLKLNSLEELNMAYNPLEDGGYRMQTVTKTLASKLPKLREFNGDQITPFLDSESDRESIKESPYKLFTDTTPKQNQNPSARLRKEWNFTLGECQESDPSICLEMLSSRDDSMNNPTLIVTVPDIKPGFQAFLKKLLPFSYVPPRPIKHSEMNQPVSVRLDPENQQYQFIDEMMKPRGGIVYLRKITNWKYNHSGCQDSTEWLGFLQEELTEKQFKLISKGSFTREFKKNLMGIQPNMFSCYHALMRIGKHAPNFGCIYAIQSTHL